MSLDLPVPDDAHLAHSARLKTEILHAIRQQGVMSFYDYMHRCLYTPGLGYYAAGLKKFGAEGDFITAPELGDGFAFALANGIATVFAGLPDTAPRVLFELGGGSGALMHALLRRLAELDCLPDQVWLLDVSPELRVRQQTTLRALPEAIWTRLQWLSGLPEQPWQGVLLANEVLDALPCERIVRHEQEWFGLGVAADGETLVDARFELGASYLALLRHALPEADYAAGVARRSQPRIAPRRAIHCRLRLQRARALSPEPAYRQLGVRLSPPCAF
jgi:SAM-dependent MidA family methyltransferase